MSDAMKAPAPPSGQGSTPVQPAGTPAGTGATPNWSPVEYQWEDGEKQTFATKEDLLKYVREGTLRHRDYTKKTQDLAKQREAQTKREKEIETLVQDLTAKKARIDPMDQFLTKRKDVADYIATQMRQPSGEAQEAAMQRMLDERLGPLKTEAEELKQWKKSQEQEAKRKEMFQHFKTQYPDFNEETITSRLKEFDELPEGEEERSLVELIHLAEKARNPLGAELKAAERRNGRPVPSVSAPPAQGEVPEGVMQSKDPIRAAAEAYKRTHR